MSNTMTARTISDEAFQKVAELTSVEYQRSPSLREHYRRDESYHAHRLPGGVLFPTSTQDVVDAVKACGALGIPLIPYGAGTSLEGHTNSICDCLVIDMRKMNRILSVNVEDLDCTCQPGVTREELNTYLRDLGAFFPVDPGANATLGGMVATAASGTNAVRYGTMKESVLALEVVMADGAVVRTARRARKTAAGYDLTHLFTGSEGTLGIITEVTLRLHAIPEVIRSATCAFPDLYSAVDCVIRMIQAGIPIARVELLDEKQMEACNRFSKLDKPVAPTLFMEFHGTAVETDAQIVQTRAIVEELGGGAFDWADRLEDRNRLWRARHEALPAAKALRPGCEALITDVCVPISKLADFIIETKRDIEAEKLVATIVGHVGDGNFHVFLPIDTGDAAEVAKAEAFHHRLAARAIDNDGTCTGEHGIGLGKKSLLEVELGQPAVQAMKLVKRSLDPKGLFNPGKIFDL